MPAPEPLATARAALAAGLPDAAYLILLSVVQAEPQHGEAWWLLATATQDPRLKATFTAKAQATGVPAPIPPAAQRTIRLRTVRRIPIGRRWLLIAVSIGLVIVLLLMLRSRSTETVKQAGFPEVVSSLQGAVDVCRQFVADKVQPYAIDRYGAAVVPELMTSDTYRVQGSFRLKNNLTASTSYTCQVRWVGDGNYGLAQLDLR